MRVLTRVNVCPRCLAGELQLQPPGMLVVRCEHGGSEFPARQADALMQAVRATSPEPYPLVHGDEPGRPSPLRHMAAVVLACLVAAALFLAYAVIGSSAGGSVPR